MKHSRLALIFSLSLALPILAVACGTGEKTDSGYENSSIEHAHSHWLQGGKSPVPFLFLDVRTPGEYAEGHVPGAKLIPLQELADRMREIPKNKQVYVYCESGVRSTKAAKILAEAGFSNIENMQASMSGWREAGYPIEK